MADDKYIEKVIKIELRDIIDCWGYEEFLDIISELVVGDAYPCLNGINYEIVGYESPYTLVIKAGGFIEDEEDND